MKTFVVTVIVLVVLAVAGLLFIAYSGVIDVGADHQDPPGLDWFLSTTSDHSVKARAKDLAVPDLSGDQMVSEGFEHYRSMCQGCHGAPGMKASPVNQGLNPRPPSLAHADAPGPAEEFWVIKHGIKMTGMPAFGVTHSDDRLWEIVAFLQRFKGMSAAEYANLVQEHSQQAAPEQAQGDEAAKPAEHAAG